MTNLNKTVKSLMVITSFIVMAGTAAPAQAEMRECQDPGWNQEWCAEINDFEMYKNTDNDTNDKGIQSDDKDMDDSAARSTDNLKYEDQSDR